MNNSHPKEMYLLALSEMCQRFAFWGVNMLLVVYLTKMHAFSNSEADHLSGLFSGLSFFLPLLGGYLADKVGYRLPVVAGSVSTALGCFLIASGSLPLVYPALFLLAVGTGVFTPGIYATLGSVYSGKTEKSEGGFSIYYASVNIGVFLATTVLGLLQQKTSWSVAFACAGAVQLFGIIPFLKVIQSPQLHSKIPDNSSLKERTVSKKLQLSKGEKHRIYLILFISVISILFWIAYSQMTNSMQLFAEKYTDRMIFGKERPFSWFSSIESLFLVLLVYPLNYLYTWLRKKGKDPSTPMKTALSFIIIALAFLVMAITTLNLKELAPAYPLVIFYMLMALAEMLIAPIGLSYVARISPSHLRGAMIGLWYVCIACAFSIGGFAAGFMDKVSFPIFFISFTIICLVAAAALFLAKKKIEKFENS